MTGFPKNPMRDLAHDACMLSAMVEGLSVLQSEADGPADCIIAKRARNSIGPLMDMVIERAWGLTRAIEEVDNPALKSNRVPS